MCRSSVAVGVLVGAGTLTYHRIVRVVVDVAHFSKGIVLITVVCLCYWCKTRPLYMRWCVHGKSKNVKLSRRVSGVALGRVGVRVVPF